MDNEMDERTRMPTMLPNGDIYLGPLPGGRPDNISAQPPPKVVNAADAALEKVVKDSTHQPQQARIECPWCGQYQEGTEAFKTHIKAQHAKALANSAQKERSEQEKDEDAMQYAMERRAKRDKAEKQGKQGTKKKKAQDQAQT